MSDNPAPGDEDFQARTRHRVANTFHFLSALARMRAQRADDPSASRGLTWMADTILDLGILERFVCADGIDVSSYLESMTQVWGDRYRRLGLKVVVETCPLILSEAAAPSLVLIVLELITHCSGHTFLGDQPPEVHLRVQAQEAGYLLTLSDTGFGMASSKDTFGLWLAKRLSQQIKGELSIQAEGGFTLAFKP